jgi:ABC-type polysaccharide/polyol phosphate export permease
VFSIIFRSVPPAMGNGEPGVFPVWLFGGLIVWNFLNQSIQQSIPALRGSGSLLQKVYFPAHVPVLGHMGSIFVQTLIELAIFGTILLLMGNVGPTWLLIPALFATFVVFVASLAIALSVLSIHYRDVAHLTGVILQLVFFLTPIIYTVDQVPAEWHGVPLQQIILLNPAAQFVVAFRQLSYGLEAPTLPAWLGLLGWTAVAITLAMLAYRRWGLDVGEAV